MSKRRAIRAPADSFTKEQWEAAERFARSAAGDDDVAYLQMLTAAFNMTHWVSTATGEDRREIAAALLKRTGYAPPAKRMRRRAAAAVGKKVYDDPVYVENDLLVVQSDTRIVGGVETGELFPECVAVGSFRRFCCTGTLIAPQVVLTAGHCHPDCTDRIFVGEDVEGDGPVINVAEAIVHPDYVPDSNERLFDDLTVLILAEPVESVTPAPIASADAVTQARTTRLVGYGNTEFTGTRGYGIRRMVDVAMASDDPAYGARVDTEFVAGKPRLDRDSCTGDSGGPAYIDVGGRWELAGATSRSTLVSERTCGDGGVYTRVPAYRDWIEQAAGPLG